MPARIIKLHPPKEAHAETLRRSAKALRVLAQVLNETAQEERPEMGVVNYCLIAMTLELDRVAETAQALDDTP